MKIDTRKLIEALKSIMRDCFLADNQEWALIITIAHLEDVLEEEESK